LDQNKETLHAMGNSNLVDLSEVKYAHQYLWFFEEDLSEGKILNREWRFFWIFCSAQSAGRF
jgi:hypothetical protein